MEIKHVNNEEKINKKFRICNICGSRQHTSNFARHLKCKKHKDVDYVTNLKFEIVREEPKERPKQDYLILK